VKFEAFTKVRVQIIKYMKTTRNQGTLDKNIQLMEYEFRTCKSFKYEGAVVTEKNETTVKMKVRKVADNRCLFAV
jgi:hypothetical protein